MPVRRTASPTPTTSVPHGWRHEPRGQQPAGVPFPPEFRPPLSDGACFFISTTFMRSIHGAWYGVSATYLHRHISTATFRLKEGRTTN